MTKNIVKGLAILFAVTVVASGIAYAGWNAEYSITTITNANAFKTPSMATDASGNTYVVWTDCRSGDNAYELYYKKLNRSTGVWDPDHRLTLNDGKHSQYPAIAMGSDGIINLVWSDNSTGHFEIYYDIITNGFLGSTATNLSNASTTSSWPSIAIDNSKNIHVVWGETGTDGNPRIYYKKFNYASSTWEAAKKLNSENSGPPRIACDSIGNVYVMWFERSASYNRWKLCYIRYNASSATWEAEAELHTNVSCAYGLSVTCDKNNNVHFVWDDDSATAGRPRVYYRWIDVVHNIKYDPVMLGNDTGSVKPVIASDTDGNLHAVWIGRGTDGIFYLNYEKFAAGAPSWESIKQISQSQLDESVVLNQLSNTALVLDNDMNPNAMFVDKRSSTYGLYFVTNAVRISSISPSHGDPGSSVIIEGSNFDASNPAVTFGSTTATVTSKTSTSLTVTVPSSISMGTCSVTVKNPDNGKATLNNAFTVDGGTIVVSTTRDGSSGISASFTITGTNSYSTISGTTTDPSYSWQKTVLPDDYKIVFNNIVGFIKPVDQTFSVAEGQTITITGDYVTDPNASIVKVKTLLKDPNTNQKNPTSASFTIEETIDGEVVKTPGTTDSSGQYQYPFLPGSVTIKFGQKGVYGTPADQTIMLNAGATITFVGTYEVDATKPGAPPTLSYLIGHTTQNGSSVTFTWDASIDPVPASGIDHYEINISGQVIDVGNVTSYTTELGDGTFDVFVNAYDRAGNKSDNSNTLSFILNSKAPDVSIVMSVNGSVKNRLSLDTIAPPIAVSPSTVVSVEASDGNGIKSNSIALKDSSGAVLESSSSSIDLSTLGLKDKEIYTVVASAEDNEGSKAIRVASIQIFSGVEIINNDVFCYPNPFNPISGNKPKDAKLSDTKMIIKFWLSNDVDTKIIIYNSAGMRVKIYNCAAGIDEGAKQNENLVEWNGKDMYGNVVANGPYLYFIVTGSKVIGQGEMTAFN